MDVITLFSTGGTIDKVYKETQGELSFNHTHIKKMLSQGRSKLNIKIQELMLVDSLEMTPAQRTKIVSACKKNSSSKIVITHGTDTMTQTAGELARENLQKTIVLTGSMIPFHITNSDSLFNLGAALAFVQTLPIGIYIVMNGHYFLWNEVQKNKELGVFENL